MPRWMRKKSESVGPLPSLTVCRSFLAWLGYLRREVEAPDLWALYRGLTKAATVKPAALDWLDRMWGRFIWGLDVVETTDG